MSVLSRFKVKGPVSLVILALSLVVVLSISSPALAASANPSSTQANWPMFGYNLQHTHYNPNETALSPSTVPKLILAWSYKTGEPILGPSTVVNGVVYIGSFDDSIHALKASTGKSLWSYKTNNQISSSPTVVNGMVFINRKYYLLLALISCML